MATARLRFWLLVAVALAAGLTLRLWFIAHEARIAGDTLVYGDIARNLVEHGIYGFSSATGDPRPTLIRLPGYPTFLAACFRVFGMEHYHAVLYLQCLADLFTCVVLAALAGRLCRRSGAALATLWLGCLCPFTASYVAAPLTETLTLLTIAVAFYGLKRWQAAVDRHPAGNPPIRRPINGWLFVAAGAVACSILLRPDQGLLAVAILPAVFWICLRSQACPQLSIMRAAAPALVATLCILAPLLPWTIRNYRTFHILQPLAPRYATDPGESVPVGFQRWYRTWAIDFISTDNAYWMYDGETINIADLPNRAFDSQDQYDRTAAVLNAYNETTSASPALDRRFADIAHERVDADLIRYYLALPAARVLNMVFRPRTEMLPLPLDWWHWRSHPLQSAIVAALAALNLAYVSLALAGLYRWRSRARDVNLTVAWSLMGFVLLRCALLLTVDNSEPRYTLEFFPIIFVAGAAFFVTPKRL